MKGCTTSYRDKGKPNKSPWSSNASRNLPASSKLKPLKAAQHIIVINESPRNNLDQVSVQKFRAVRAMGSGGTSYAIHPAWRRPLLCCNKSDTFRFISEAACRSWILKSNFNFEIKFEFQFKTLKAKFAIRVNKFASQWRYVRAGG